MLKNTKKMINKLKNIFAKETGIFSKSRGSLRASPQVIKAFKEDPDRPFLVSFPRTGSHWLRMLMELYFEKPGLVRIFFYEHANSFTCLHTHDLELDVERSRVIYLYREPINTVFSQLSYYKENINNLEIIRHWSERYGKHLSKWLLEETFTAEKTIITYEGLKEDLGKEFIKICSFFKTDFDLQRLDRVAAQVSKVALKEKTIHDGKVVNLSQKYREERDLFCETHGAYVIERVIAQNIKLKELF